MEKNYTNPKEFEKKDQFLDLKIGEHKIRLLTEPLEYYEVFIKTLDGKLKPHRCILDRTQRNPYEHVIKNFYNPKVEEFREKDSRIKSMQEFSDFKRKFSDINSNEAKSAIQAYENENQVLRLKNGLAFVCYEYSTKSIKVASFTQATINDFLYSTLTMFSKENICLSSIDFTIKREGNGLNSKYSIMQSPKATDILELKDGDIEVAALFYQNRCSLKKMLVGEYPFTNVVLEEAEELICS